MELRANGSLPVVSQLDAFSQKTAKEIPAAAVFAGWVARLFEAGRTAHEQHLFGALCAAPFLTDHWSDMLLIIGISNSKTHFSNSHTPGSCLRLQAANP